MQRRTSILMAAVGALALSAFGLDHVVEQSQIKRSGFAPDEIHAASPLDRRARTR